MINKILNFFMKKNGGNQKKFFNKELDVLVKNNMDEFKNNYILYKANCCPSCGCILQKKIKATGKCPECKEKIIVRTNRINKEKLFLTQSNLKRYEKYEKKLKEITFCEKYIKAISEMYPYYMHKFYELKSKKRDMSVRDYTFSFESWLTIEIDHKAYYKYMNGLKQNFQSKIWECDNAVMLFKKSSNIFRFMIELTKFEGKDDIALEMMLSLLYRNVEIAHLRYYHWKDKVFDKVQFYLDINDSVMYLIQEYIQKQNTSIENLKENFMIQAHPFMIDIVPKDEAWALIVDAYYKYLELIKTNDFEVYRK